MLLPHSIRKQNSTDGHTRGQAIYCLRGCNLAISSYVDDIKGIVN